MQISRTYLSIATVLLVTSAVALGAQAPRDRAAAPPTTELSTLARGWAALADGRAADAIKAADSVLGGSPGSHRAVDLKIEALAATAPTQALDSYEAWLNRTRIEAVFLLVPIARGTLTQIAEGTDSALAMQARLRLAETGSPQDVAKLQEFMKTGTSANSPAAPNPQRDLQLALQGDTSAAVRLANEKAASAVPPQPLARALAGAGAAGVPVLRALLKNPAAPVRMEAALALGKVGAVEAAPDIKAMMQDPQVRAYAAVALTMLGDPAGEPVVQELLASPVFDMRILAAQAYEGKGPGPWVEALMPALKDPNGLTRIRAAEMLAPVAPDAALPVLQEASKDPNPVIRADVMRVFEKTGLLTKTQQQASAGASGVDAKATSLEALRRMLRDPDASTRLYAAGAILSMARGVS